MKNNLYLFLLIIFSSTLQGQSIVDIVVDSPDHETLEAAVIAAGLAETLNVGGPFTLFAPTDEAFAALPAGTVEALLEDPTGALTDILLYHAIAADVRSTDLSDGMTATTVNGKDVTITINDNGVFINNAQVTVADILADNGVVHVIDAVLIPPATTVVDIVVNSPDHETLEAAVIAAGLAETLSGEGPFTLFAPTDEAFAALPAGTVETLLEDPTGALTDILLYHAISGNILSTDLVDGTMAATINGANVSISVSPDGVFINDALVTVADIITDNGVVHVINAVLIPGTNTSTNNIINTNLSFKASPNPFSDNFSIEFEEALTEQVNARLFDLTGKEILTKMDISNKEIIDFPNLNSGTYLLSIEKENSTEIVRIIKQ